MSLISERYAEAFFEISKGKGKLDQALEELDFLRQVWFSQENLRGFLKNPRKSPGDKEKAVRGIFSDVLSDDTLHLVLLLLRKNRMELLPDIYQDVAAWKDQSQNIISITVTTAEKAEPDVIRQISKRFCSKYHAADAHVSEVIDPAIIGGVIVQVGDDRYDDSVAGQLKALQTQLVQG